MKKIRLKRKVIKGIKCLYREGFSDLKTFEEVIGRDTYQKKNFKLEPGETWLDCGGNVGAFALLACSKGCNVTVVEPDPNNIALLEKNLKANNFNADIIHGALVHDDRKQASLSIGTNGNVWRNSIVKQWNSHKRVKVPCVNFDAIACNFSNVKMDIEGAEMPILETTLLTFDKLVYEWSFDIDKSLSRFWKVIERQQAAYRDLNFPRKTTRFDTRELAVWQDSWFPACVNVFARR